MLTELGTNAIHYRHPKNSPVPGSPQRPLRRTPPTFRRCSGRNCVVSSSVREECAQTVSALHESEMVPGRALGPEAGLGPSGQWWRSLQSPRFRPTSGTGTCPEQSLEAALFLKRPSRSKPARRGPGRGSGASHSNPRGRVLSFLLGLGQLQPAPLLHLDVCPAGWCLILQRHLGALPSDV